MRSNRIDEAQYEIKKRHAGKPHTQPSKEQTIFYVTRKTNIQSVSTRVKKALETYADEVNIYGLGGSLNRALVLVLEIQKLFLGVVQFHLTTSTVKVTDDLFPLSDECEMGQRDRPISAVHITCYMKRAS